MSTQDAATRVRAVVQRYVDACRDGDANALRSVFHPQALLSGYLAGDRLLGDMEPFYAAVAGNPPPAVGEGEYRAEISGIEVSGGIAVAILREQRYLGMDFVNHFQLLEVDGEWVIVAKLFQSS